MRYSALLFLFAPSLLGGCSPSEHYNGVSLTDPRLEEFSDAHSVDRASLKLPLLPQIANVQVERQHRENRLYDAMLHVYAKGQSRTIAFQSRDGKMKWVNEQVLIYGPNRYQHADGTSVEHVTLTYGTVPVSGHAANQLSVTYWGADDKLRLNSELKIDDVMHLLREWHDCQ